MLKKFSVTNFLVFEKTFVYDLTSSAKYDSHTPFVNDGIINKALIIGKNGSGKSCLGLALSDIARTISHLSSCSLGEERGYRNLNNPASSLTEFSYLFSYKDNTEITYYYSKKDSGSLVEEKVMVGDKEALKFDHTGTGALSLDRKLLPELANFALPKKRGKGSVMLDIRAMKDFDPSSVTGEIISFAEGFLYIANDIGGTGSSGLSSQSRDDALTIARANKAEDFSHFLHRNGIEYSLSTKDKKGNLGLFASYKKGFVPFVDVASSGARLLLSLYAWSLSFAHHLSFLYIDGFDSFFSFSTSELVYKSLARDPSFQAVFALTGTYLLKFEFTRPDCAFLIDGKAIAPISHCYNKELRHLQNLEKMYREGLFVIPSPKEKEKKSKKISKK